MFSQFSSWKGSLQSAWPVWTWVSPAPGRIILCSERWCFLNLVVTIESAYLSICAHFQSIKWHIKKSVLLSYKTSNCRFIWEKIIAWWCICDLKGCCAQFLKHWEMGSHCFALQWLSCIKTFPIQVLPNQPVPLSSARVIFSSFFLFLFFFVSICPRLTFTSVTDGVVVEAASISACPQQVIGQEDSASLICGYIFSYICSHMWD